MCMNILLYLSSTYLLAPFSVFQLIFIASCHSMNTFQGESWPVISDTRQLSASSERTDTSWRWANQLSSILLRALSRGSSNQNKDWKSGWEGTGL